jgi:hypothetical protein
MAMANRIRRELGKNREMLWHFLEGEKCFFCKELLIEETAIAFGNATAQPLAVPLTIHHKDGNHKNNAKRNRVAAHQSCHKSFEAKRVFAKWRKELAALGRVA